jgi:hypothetical protein
MERIDGAGERGVVEKDALPDGREASVALSVRPNAKRPLAGPSWSGLRFNGAGEEIRTLDPNLGKVVLYH